MLVGSSLGVEKPLPGSNGTPFGAHTLLPIHPRPKAFSAPPWRKVDGRKRFETDPLIFPSYPWVRRTGMQSRREGAPLDWVFDEEKEVYENAFIRNISIIFAPRSSPT
jgi:hypothetical protein